MSYQNRQQQKRKITEDNKKKRKHDCEEQLKTKAYVSCRTIFVGAVSKIEQSFGELWGSDEIDEDNMTDEQKKWFEVFLDIRDAIFDQGNSEMKSLLRYIDMYDICPGTKNFFMRTTNKDDSQK